MEIFGCLVAKVMTQAGDGVSIVTYGSLMVKIGPGCLGHKISFKLPSLETLGQFGAANTPGSKSDACTTLDDQGDLWLFGGYYF